MKKGKKRAGKDAGMKKPPKKGGKTDGKPTVKAGRQPGGKFAAGNKLGKRFGHGQPLDHGGRPRVNIRLIIQEELGKKINNAETGELVEVARECTRAQIVKAVTGDTRAFEALLKHGFDEVDEKLDSLKDNPAMGAAVTVDYRQFPGGMDGK